MKFKCFSYENPMKLHHSVLWCDWPGPSKFFVSRLNAENSTNLHHSVLIQHAKLLIFSSFCFYSARTHHQSIVIVKSGSRTAQQVTQAGVASSSSSSLSHHRRCSPGGPGPNAPHEHEASCAGSG